MRSFTLLELIIVIIIIGILAGGLAMPSFYNAKLEVLRKDAFANLKLIQSAEKIYRMETGKYYPETSEVTDIGLINENLKLSLSEENWDYVIGINADRCNIKAVRIVHPACSYELFVDEINPTQQGTCP